MSPLERFLRRANKALRAQMHGAHILLLLRNEIANDWASLCREFGLNPKVYHTGHYFLRHKLDELREAGLVVFDDGDNARGKGIAGQIELSDNWKMIQTALGISLVELVELETGESLVVKPYFGRPDKPPKLTDLFVLMPFRPDLKPVYDDHITNVTRRLGLTVARADDFFTAQSVMSDIWAAICATRAIVADCTGRNPNAFYEIGIAHVVGKPVVLITQNSDDVPFDLRHLRYIQYEFTPRGMKLFEQSLAETLKIELGLNV